MKTNKGQVKEGLDTARIVLTVIAIILVLIYIISPIDLIPDVIPVIGWIDDIVVAFLILGAVLGYWKR